MGILASFPRASTADRRVILGASAAPVLLGLSPWESPMGLWLKMQSGEELADNPAMQRGRYLESGVLRWTADTTGAVEVESGIPISEPGLVGPEPWLGMHPDGFLRYADGWRLAEIKTSRSSFGWGEDGTDELPPVYLAQVQAELACVPSIGEATVGAYLANEDRLRTYRVRRDEAFIRHMLDVMGNWYYRHIGLRIPPDVDGSEASSSYLATQHPRATNPVREATEEESLLVRRLAELKALGKSAKAEEDVVANKLREAIGEAKGVSVAGLGRVLWTPVSGAETVDAKTLRASYPEAWEAVKKRGAARRDLKLVLSTPTGDE